MNWNQLRYVLTIAEEKSITRAAQRLYLTQPSLSLRLKALEEELGTPLFTRGPDGLEPTYAGSLFCAWAAETDISFGRLNDKLSDIASGRRQLLRLGVSPHRGNLLLPTILSAFYRQFPSCEVHTVELSTTLLRLQLDAKQLDFIVDVPSPDTGNVLWPPVGAIVRASAFLEVNPGREIYAGAVGQNFQMFFPLAVRYSACYSPEILGAYLIRETSHSRQQTDYVKRQFDHEDTWIHTIMRAPLSNQEKSKAIIRTVNYFERLKDVYCGKIFPSAPEKSRKSQKIRLFGFIPLLKICRKKHRTVVKLFDFIPFLKIR